MHFVSALDGGRGATSFAPLKETLASLEANDTAAANAAGVGVSDSAQSEWGWRFLNFVPAGRGARHHPLCYKHPRTGDDTLFFHLGRSFLRSFAKATPPRTQPSPLMDEKRTIACANAIQVSLCAFCLSRTQLTLKSHVHLQKSSVVVYAHSITFTHLMCTFDPTFRCFPTMNRRNWKRTH
jgi:hypothetical protein